MVYLRDVLNVVNSVQRHKISNFFWFKTTHEHFIRNSIHKNTFSVSMACKGTSWNRKIQFSSYNYKTNRKYQLKEHKKTHNVNSSTTRVSKQPRQKSNKLLEPETHLASMLIADNMLIEPEEMDEVQRSQDEKEMFEDSLTVLKIYKLLKRMTNR